FRAFGQVFVGFIIGATMYFHPEITVRLDDNVQQQTFQTVTLTDQQVANRESKALVTTIPFVKNNELDYSKALTWINQGYVKYAWLLFIPIVIFIVTAVSNGANLTDGIDGL